MEVFWSRSLRSKRFWPASAIYSTTGAKENPLECTYLKILYATGLLTWENLDCGSPAPLVQQDSFRNPPTLPYPARIIVFVPRMVEAMCSKSAGLLLQFFIWA